MGAGKTSVTINATGGDIAIYNAFKEMVTGAKVLDGDLRINNGTLEKVNFGGKARRFFSGSDDLCNLQAGDSTEIKEQLIRGLTARLNEMAGIPQEQKDALINRLKLIVGNEGGVPLSRRTVSLVVQIVESRGENSEDVLNGMYNGMTWKMVGGRHGIRMTQTQFETMFDEAMKIAVNENTKDKLGLETALKYYKDQFKSTNNAADLERFITGSLDPRTIASKMIAHLKEGLIPSKKNKNRTDVQCEGVLSQAMRTKIEAVRQAEMLYGSRAIADKIDVTVLTQREDEANPAAAAKNFASDILLNADMREVAFSGFGDGERIGRLLLKNAGVFHRICNSVVERERIAAANRKNPKVRQEMPPECAEIRSLRLVSPKLAEDFTALISRLAKSVVTLKSGENDESFSRRLVEKAESIYTAITDFKATVNGKEVNGFERIIEARLAERMFVPPGEDEDAAPLVERFFDELEDKYPGDKYKTNVQMVHMILLKTPPSTLRRMFAYSLRENRCDLDDEQSRMDEKFSYAGMIRGLGPLATKLIQGMNPEKEPGQNDDLGMDDGDVQNKKTDAYGISKALLDTSGNNPDINPEILRAVIYDTLQSRDVEFDSVQITRAAGAGSVAQALMCKVYSGDEAPADRERNVNNAKDIIIKVIRPDIKAEFDSEVEAIRSILKGIGDDEKRKKAVFYRGFVGDAPKLEARRIENCLVPFVNDISKELDPKSELINALKGLQTYGQPRDRDRQDSQGDSVMRQWNLGNGAKVDVKSTVSVGSERLILKKGIDLDQPFVPGGPSVGKHIVDQLNSCREDGDFEKVLNDYFICDNEYTMLIETAGGSDISAIIQNYADSISNAVNNGGESFSIDEIKQCGILKNRDELVRLSRSFAVLSEKFVNGALFAKTPFVHGDLQPGNIRYNDTTGEIVLIDYGKAMTLKPVESDALKILFQMERRPPTPADADLMLEAYRSLVDSEIDRLVGDGNADQVKLKALGNIKSDLKTDWKKEEFKIACRQFDGDRANAEKNLFGLLTGMLQERNLPVPKALTMFNESYSRLLRTANTVNDAIKEYDKAIVKTLHGVAGEAKDALADLSKGGGLCLDNVGFVHCTTGDNGDILVSEKDVSPKDGGSQSLSAVLKELNDSIFNTKDHVPLRVRRRAAKDAIVLLKHEQGRLKEFQTQFGATKELVKTLEGYGLQNPKVTVSGLEKCNGALGKISNALKGLNKFVQTLDADDFDYDYDDGIFQTSLLGSKEDKRSLDDQFGGNSSAWRQHKPVASEIDYVLGAVVKNSHMPEKCRERFDELVVQSDLSWPKKLYLLTKKDLQQDEFAYLSQKLSDRVTEENRGVEAAIFTENMKHGSMPTEEDNQCSLYFDDNAKKDVDSFVSLVKSVKGKDYNKLRDLANELKISLPKSLDKKYGDSESVAFGDVYLKLLHCIAESVMPAQDKAPGFKEAQKLREEFQKNKDISIMRFASTEGYTWDLPAGFPLKENQIKRKLGAGTVRDVASQLFDIPDVRSNAMDLETFLDKQLSIDLAKEENENVKLYSAEDLHDKAKKGKYGLDVYKKTLEDVNRNMPDNLKLTFPKGGVTVKDYFDLQDYTIPLEGGDVDEFNRMLAKLKEASSSFNERIDDYRARKPPTRGDFKRLSRDICQAFSGEALASKSIEYRYDKVLEFMKKEIPFDPPPDRDGGRITLAAYGDLIRTMRYQLANSFVDVRHGSKLESAGKNLPVELKDLKLETIGDYRRAYDKLFESKSEKCTRLKKLMAEPAGGDVPVDKRQEIKTDAPALQKLVDVAGNEKLGLPTLNIGKRESVPIDEVKALYQEVIRIEDTQPRINDIPGIAANLFRGNRPESGQGGDGNAPAWDLTKRQDTSLHFKSYTPLKAKDLSFAAGRGRDIWTKGLGGQLLTGSKESYIAYVLALDQVSVESSPDLKDRMERRRQEIVDKTLESVRDEFARSHFEKEGDFTNKYLPKCQERLKAAADGARSGLFEMDRFRNYVHNDELFDALRLRIDGNPDKFKFDKFDVNDPNHIMLLEAGLLIDELKG